MSLEEAELREAMAHRLHAASQEALAGQPLLERWAIDRSLGGACLVGYVSGHPLIADGRFMRSSLIRRHAPEAGWALTLNRFYRLGTSMEDWLTASLEASRR
ncbi:DUF6634 family protein [Methylopila sp. Yamaguchi]|uniref:DUF6634 family protein n=1 Tax=Methylopila sp. Yamaguchi TaxID=1437817 RepID=UPI000CC142B3|nr:DUF6634 family protein [Methylopila sp. Yamaguchi]GBD46858.1 hypothetical protein METY_0071 [Methylopila sp. Yamaguchi]